MRCRAVPGTVSGYTREAMVLERLQLTNFRGFESLDLRFEPDLTVLVGVNGCGKTSVLDALLIAFGKRGTSSLDLRTGAAQMSICMDADGAPPRIHEAGVVDGSFQVLRSGDEELPYLLLAYHVDRPATDHTPGTTAPREWQPEDARQDPRGPDGYQRFFRWFREMEDEENERFRHEEHTELPPLSATRSAIHRLLPGYGNLRVLRRGAMGVKQPRLAVEKGGDVLLFDVLSEGERSIIAMVADIARRLTIANPDSSTPLEEPFVLLIDEFEQHLHPQWQRELPKRLREVFPGAQLVLTTHSPIVVSELLPRQIRAIQGFQVLEGSHREGQDVNEILETLFGTPSRRRRTQALIDAVDEALDDDPAQASEPLEALETQLGANDPEVVRLRTLQRFAGLSDHDAVSEG